VGTPKPRSPTLLLDYAGWCIQINVATRSFALSYTETVFDKKVSYRKQIAREHSWSTCSLITMQKFVVVSHTVFTHVGGPSLADVGTPPPWDDGVADSLETRFSPHVSSYQISSPWIMLRWNCRSVIMQIRQKIWPVACRLSRSLEVIETDTDRSA